TPSTYTTLFRSEHREQNNDNIIDKRRAEPQKERRLHRLWRKINDPFAGRLCVLAFERTAVCCHKLKTLANDEMQRRVADLYHIAVHYRMRPMRSEPHEIACSRRQNRSVR